MTDIAKSEWGDGPWQNEPDRLIWIDDTTDLPCLLSRHLGAWCGYVGVPPGHPADGLSYYKSDFDIDEIESGVAAARLRAQKAINDITVHGGLTFSGRRDFLLPAEARCRDWHFFGFDCNHAGDFDPHSRALLRSIQSPADFARGNQILGLGQPTGWGGVIEYRDIEYAKRECASLAQQLAAIRL